MGLVLAGIAAAAVVLFARTAPMAALVAVAVAGGLHANGVVRLPAPDLLTRASARVSAVQERAVQGFVCRQVVLRASEADLARVEQQCASAPR
ncbi:MAG TPA: hypothetical protein VD931_04855 [Baekduia sp.]|nr:hypothetical protein [Baekduia sp.]